MSGKGSDLRPILNYKKHDETMEKLYHIKINNKYYKKIRLMDEYGEVIERLVEVDK